MADIFPPLRSEMMLEGETPTIRYSTFFDNLADSANNLNTFILQGEGTPETVVTANVGTVFLRTDGGAGTTLYVKESGTGNTGWIGK